MNRFENYHDSLHKKIRDRVEEERFLPFDLRNMKQPIYDHYFESFACVEFGMLLGRELKGVEVAFKKSKRFFTKTELEVSKLKRAVHCRSCEERLLLRASEIEILSRFRDGCINRIAGTEGEFSMTSVKDGLAEELYVKDEITAEGEHVYTRYYGPGHARTLYTRVIFLELEIVAFVDKILADSDQNPETIKSKKRYIKAIVEAMEVLETTWGNFPNHDLDSLDERVFENYGEAYFCLGFLIAEFRWKFLAEGKAALGLSKARQRRLKDGAQRKIASLNAAKAMLKAEPSLISNMSKLSSLIEEKRLPEHRQKNGQFIGRDAIATHIRAGVRAGFFKIS